MRNQTRYEHTYMVQKGTDKKIYINFLEQHNTVMGFSTFRKCKPFYVRACNPADIETCCCIYHVNFRNGFEALCAFFKDINFQPDEKVLKVAKKIETYWDFKHHLFMHCNRDEYGILIVDCESGLCGHWNKQFTELIHTIIEIETEKKCDKKFAFTRFQYVKTEEYGTRLTPIVTPLNLSEICEFIKSKLKTFVKHSNQHLRDTILWNIFKSYTITDESALKQYPLCVVSH